MTNREFIESKTDEELAQFYYELIGGCIKLGFYHANYENDYDKILEYLRSDVNPKWLNTEN